jgi:hypothetical protein
MDQRRWMLALIILSFVGGRLALAQALNGSPYLPELRIVSKNK